MQNNKVIGISKEEFADFVKDGFVFIDFFASWCMPCLMMAPVIEELNEKFRGKIKFGKIDVDENQELAGRFNVASIPNMILFKNGKPIDQFIGAISSENLEKKLLKYVK